MITGQAEWVEIPHEPGNALNLADLNWKQLKEAKSAYSDEQITRLRSMGPDVVNALPKPDEAAKITASVDTYESYDRGTLLRYGVKGWRGPVYDGHAFDIDLLDDRTAEWAAEAIYRRSRIEGAEAGKLLASSARITGQEKAAGDNTRSA